MLRRQKSTIIDGNPICVIPPKHVHLHNVALSTAEKEFYRNIEAKGQALINRYLGPDRTDAPHAAVLAHILRLRQACCHAYLVTLLGQQEPVQGVSDEDLKRCAQHFGRDVVERLRQGFEAECPICFDIASNPTIFFPCGHSSCSECCQKLFETSASANCPQCRRILNHKAITDYKSFCFVHFPGQWADGFPTESSDHESETLAEARRASRRNKDCKTKYLRRLGEDFQSSTKIDMAMSLLAKIRTDDPTEKTIIFSQFTALLDLVEVSLRGEGYKYQRYDGTMKMDERAEAVEDFMDRSEVNIILVSLRAGNAGLNLNKASQVILLDPFWNPFLEDQAVDRAHRMHQAREVHVHRLLVPETVEDRILQLQADKRELVEIAMNEGKLGRAGAGLSREEVRYLVTGQRGN
jgi:SNF2 family DNA or RNA helicase